MNIANLIRVILGVPVLNTRLEALKGLLHDTNFKA